MPAIRKSVCRPPEAEHALASAALIKQAAPRHLICEADGRQPSLPNTLVTYQRLAKATGADVT